MAIRVKDPPSVFANQDESLGHRLAALSFRILASTRILRLRPKGSIFSGKYDQFHTIRENIERKYMETIDLVPGLAERVLAGRRGDRLYAR